MFKKWFRKLQGIFINELRVQRPDVPLNRKQRRSNASIKRKQAQRRKDRG